MKNTCNNHTNNSIIFVAGNIFYYPECFGAYRVFTFVASVT